MILHVCFRTTQTSQQVDSDSEDEMDKMERDRMQDLKERDEFAKRLLDKDKDKQRSVMSKSERKVQTCVK